MMKPQPLTIEGEVFDDLRMKLNLALNSALTNMIRYRISAGTVAMNIEIELEEGTAEDGTAEDGNPIQMPKFSGKIGINLPMKAKIEMERREGMIMVRDERGDGYIVASGQYSFLDMLEEQKNG